MSTYSQVSYNPEYDHQYNLYKFIGLGRNRKIDLLQGNQTKYDNFLHHVKAIHLSDARTQNNFNKQEFREFTSQKMKKNPNIGNLAQTIYNNFFELARYPILKHNKYEIHRLLTSPNLIMFAIYNGNNMIAYLIGEIMKLNDGRNVLYISYLYVSSKYRNVGLGSALLNKAIVRASLLNANTVILIVDTEDQKNVDFYMKRGFVYDPYLRRYDKYDVLSLSKVLEKSP